MERLTERAVELEEFVEHVIQTAPTRVPGTAVFDGQAGSFDAADRGFAQFELIGRLAPGVSLDQARAVGTNTTPKPARRMRIDQSTSST